MLIPEKLYGREREVGALLSAFDRVVTNGTSALVLVSGYSGVGKSSVVNELHKALVPPRGLFASGKFDQHKRDIPYATLAQVFQRLIDPILSKSEAEFDRWRKSVLEALGANGQLLVDLVPELESSSENKSRSPNCRHLTPSAASSHYCAGSSLSSHALNTRSLCFSMTCNGSTRQPWNLLEDLLIREPVPHLLLIGAYRDNEIDASHPLLRKLDSIKATGVSPVEEITLTALDAHNVSQLVADALQCETGEARELAQLILQKTDGNPFFIIQFLSTLAEEALIVFDYMRSRWCWDLNLIHAKGYTDNVVELMIGKLARLSTESRQALQRLACLGNMASVAMLAKVHDTTEQELHIGFFEARRHELVDFRENSYRFVHDRVHESAYALIPMDQRAALHLRVGRMLLVHTTPDKLDEAVFEIVNQLNRGASLVTAPEERERLAELNLLAAKRAQASSAYASALNYLTAGAALLTEDCWEKRRELIFAIELRRAHCEFACGTIVKAQERLRGLAIRAISTEERAEVACLHVDLCQAIDRNGEAVTVGLRALRHLGVDIPEHPTEADARDAYSGIWTRLGTRAIEDLVHLPRASDPDAVAALDLLIKVAVPGHFFASIHLLAVAVCTAVSLGLERGHSDASCFAYLQVGNLAGPMFGDFDAGYRFGRLGCDLVERPGLRRFQARTFEVFGHLVAWTQPVQRGREFLFRAFDLASQTGEISYAGFACGQLNTNYLMAGNSLIEVQAQAERGLAFARKVQFGTAEAWILGQLGLIRSLRGLTNRLGSFDDERFSEKDFERELAGNPALAFPEFWYYIRKLQARFLAGEYLDALKAASRALPLLWNYAFVLETVECRFFDALCHAAVYGSASLKDRAYHRARLTEHLEKLDTWALHGPENFDNRAALVAAELARIEGRGSDAEQLYERAINSARAAEFVHNEAIANELAGRFYLARGLETAGYAYLRSARECYDRWGAVAKVAQLDERYPRLRDGLSAAFSSVTLSSSGQLDVEAVVKASQALSSEILLPKLIERLLRIAVEHAGAERALLILLQENQPRIVAEASTGLGTIEVIERQQPVTAADLPQSALHYVIRTRERVLLDDASADNLYSQDEYVGRAGAKSVLCLPILQQARLVAVLYLENNLAPFVFTPARVAILQLLASQAAISLENAALYTELQLQVDVLQQLPVSAWTLKPDGTPDFVNHVWLEFSGHTLEFLRSDPEAWMTAVHPEDRAMAAKCFWEGVHSGQGFAFETRSLRARDETYRRHLQQVVVLRDSAGKVVKFVGTTTDIEDQKRAEEALRQAQGDLARVARVATLSAMTASIAHEVSQPLRRSDQRQHLRTDAGGRSAQSSWRCRDGSAGEPRRQACLRGDPAPAGDVSAKPPTMERVDLNDVAREVIVLSAGEVQRKRCALADGLRG